jgi:6-bladed beta-propeller
MMRWERCWGGAAAVLLTVAPLSAQQVIEISGEDRPLNAGFEELYRVGSLDGEVWETFGEIAGTAFDAAGNLYIFDRQANRIVKVDAAGNFVREIGQAGEGPGEFRLAMGFTVMPDGRVIVADIGHSAYHIFNADGDFERMVGMGGGGLIRLGDLAPLPDGHSIVSGGGGVTMSMSGGSGGPPAPPTTRPIDRIDLSGEEAVTEALAEAWQPPRGKPATMEGGGMRFSMSVAAPSTFEPGLFTGVLPNGGIAYADSSTYAIKIVGPDGGVERILRRPFSPEPVTEKIEEAEKARRLAELEEGEGPKVRMMVAGPGGGSRSISQDAIKEMMKSQLESMTFFSELSVIRDLATSWGGKVWVQRRGEEPESDGALDVLTPEGRYVGTFAAGVTEIPSSFGPNGMAAYIEMDEFDVPTVVVRRLPAILN